MNTIDKILDEYSISKEMIKIYKQNWVCNWCWGKGWFNFWEYFRKNVEKFKNYKKINNFINDLENVCNLHDIEYFRWRNFKDFIIANKNLIININLLLHWTGFLRRILISFLVFFWTTLFGWKYFKNKTF
jgi:hypothetical protein